MAPKNKPLKLWPIERILFEANTLANAAYAAPPRALSYRETMYWIDVSDIRWANLKSPQPYPPMG